jgi:hypothetical protein
VYDLLTPGSETSILGDGTILSTTTTSGDPIVLEDTLAHALGNRTRRATALNQDSSRSHTIAVLTIAGARLFIVDLAGCERVSQSKATGIGLAEAIAINKSLSSLHAVVYALTETLETKRVHIPYRNAKITMALKQALGGNSRTSFILCCASRRDLIGESRHTLEFGTRCKAIVTIPVTVSTTATRGSALAAKDLLIKHLEQRIVELECLVKRGNVATVLPRVESSADCISCMSPLSLDSIIESNTHNSSELIATVPEELSTSVSIQRPLSVSEKRRESVYHERPATVESAIQPVDTKDVKFALKLGHTPSIKVSGWCCR